MSDDAQLIVAKWPDRKRKTLALQEGVNITLLATFQSDEAADLFIELARRGIMFNEEESGDE